MSNRKIRRLKKDLAAPKTKHRLRAVAALLDGRLPGEAAHPLLVEALFDPEPEVGARARAGLLELGPGVAPLLLEALRERALNAHALGLLEAWRDEIIAPLANALLTKPSEPSSSCSPPAKIGAPTPPSPRPPPPRRSATPYRPRCASLSSSLRR